VAASLERRALEAASEDVCHQRNSGDGQPSLEAVDRLTDAVTAYFAAMDRVKARIREQWGNVHQRKG